MPSIWHEPAGAGGVVPRRLDRAGTAKTEYFNHLYRNDRVVVPLHGGLDCRPRVRRPGRSAGRLGRHQTELGEHAHDLDPRPPGRRCLGAGLARLVAAHVAGADRPERAVRAARASKAAPCAWSTEMSSRIWCLPEVVVQMKNEQQPLSRSFRSRARPSTPSPLARSSRRWSACSSRTCGSSSASPAGATAQWSRF